MKAVVSLNKLPRKLRELLKIGGKLSLVMASLALLPIISFLVSTKVHADNFWSSGGDVGECNVASVIGVQYNNLGGGSGVQWDNSNLDGVSGNWIQNNSFLTVADITYPDAHKYPYIADRVAVPPKTRVDIGMWTYSYAGHGANINSVYLFTSQENPANGDLTNLGAGGSYGTIGMNGFPSRSGKYIQTGYVGWYGDYSNTNGSVIYSFETIQPIEASNFTATPIWNGANLSVRYDMQINNVSSYNLCNIRVRDVMPTGAVYDQNHCVNAGQTITVSYSEDYGTSYPSHITNDPAIVWDNNWHEENQSGVMPDVNSGYEGNLRPAVAVRDDLGAPAGWNADQPVWGQINRPPINVALIPYWFNTGSAESDVQPNVTIQKTVSDNDETNVQNNTSRNRENLTYNVTVSNTGGRTTGLTVIDDYDQNYLNITNTNGGIDDGDKITWSLPTLEHGQTVNYTVNAQIKDLSQGSYSFQNIATTAPVWGEDRTTTIVNASANISLSKMVTDSDETNVTADTIQGDQYLENERKLTFTISYGNTGDADATDVVLIDNLSEFVNAELLNRVDNISNGGIYDSNTHIITWNIGTLGDGQSGSVTFDIYLNRTAQQDRSLVNTAIIDTDQTTPLSTTTTTTVITPNYQISKTDGETTANTGEVLTYTITFNNNGTGHGYNIVVSDILPQYVENVSNISNGGTYNSNTRTITWNSTNNPAGINLNSGESRNFTYQFTVPTIMPIGTTVLNNRASIESPTKDKVWGEDNTSVDAIPNLDIQKLVLNVTARDTGRNNSGNGVSSENGADANTWNGDPNDVIAITGDVLEFTLVYRNTGNANSPTTFVADQLPRYIIDTNGNQFEIVRAEDFVSVDGGITPVANGTSWDIVWNLGTLNVSSEYSVKKFRVRINPDSETTYTQDDLQRILNNTSQIYSTNNLVTPDSDNAVYRIDQPVATILKSSDKVIYQSNENVVYEITVSNTSDTRAVGVVKDTLPDKMHFISSTPSTNRNNGNNLEWDLTLEAGETKTIQVTVGFDTPVEDKKFFNNQVVYDYKDINNNNRPEVNASAQVQVLAPIIEVKKEQIEDGIVTPLNTIKYTVTMTNVGSGIGYSVNIKDSIKVDLVDVVDGSISDGGVYDSSTQTITWSLGDIQPNQSIVRSFTARVKLADTVHNGDVIENKVTVNNDTSATIESNTVSSEISCGYLSGTIWEDKNKNALIDAGEYRIPNANIVVTVGGFEQYKVTFVSNGQGQYIASCLPYEKETYVDIVRPNGYVGQTTVDNYKVQLTQSGSSTIYKLDEKENTLYVWTGGNFTHADLGLYRTKIGNGSVLGISTMAMSNTGTPLVVVFGIATLLLVGAYLFIVDKDKILIKTKSLINLSGAKKWHQS